MADVAWLVPLLPFIAFAINGVFGRKYLKKHTGLIANAGVLGALVVSVALFVTRLDHAEPESVVLWTWAVSGDFALDIALRVDALTLVMLLVVTSVSFMVHVYSIGYMDHDPGFWRFFTYLPLFVFAMIMLVMANNLLVLFVFWEAVGLCSYLLIGFWFERQSASAAAIKAFLTNRIGDVGFLIGLLLAWYVFGTLDYDGIFAQAPAVAAAKPGMLTLICLMLFVGAMGKSAQFPLHVWLPDAMEGPTPVSALIHAATMVTAGVYMVARFNPLYVLTPSAMAVVAIVGAFTALFAATIGLAQNDIKRVLAYSTVSQLGLMFMALGVGAFTAAIFHLATHAFFKGLLFLGSGSVIHGTDEEQDMQRMGGLFGKMPVTGSTYIIGGLALSGIIPLAGFWSKDELLGATLLAGGSGYLLYALGAMASFLTAVYTFRMIFLTFFGKTRMESERFSHVHESPRVMTISLIVLAVGAVFAGFVGVPPEHGLIHNYLHDTFLAAVLAGLVHKPSTTFVVGVMVVSTLIALCGILIAYSVYMRRTPAPEAIASKARPIHALLVNKYFLDEFYDTVLAGGTRGLGWLFAWFDLNVVDGLVNLLGLVVSGVGGGLRRMQTGRMENYAFSVVLGTALVLAFYIIMVR